MSSAARVLARLERLAVKRSFSAEGVCIGPDGKRFLSQFEAIRSRAKRKAYFCTRRAGKTEGIAAEILLEVLSGPPGIVAYVTQTLKAAKHLVWPIIKRLNRDFQLGGIANESESYMRFPSDTGFERRVYLGGCKDKTEIERLRGFQKSKAWFLDEVQSVPERIIRPLLDEIVTPSLLDYGGRLVVSGTPGPLPVGYFYDVTQGALAHEWEVHAWTWQENPHIQWDKERNAPRPRNEVIADILRSNSWTPETPAYRREYLGEWVTDWNSLVFRYDAAVNHFEELPRLTNYVFGVDIGYDDDDAIAVLGWGPDSPTLYLVDEWLAGDQTVSDLSLAVQRMADRYPPDRIVCDTGGNGKKVVKSLASVKGVVMEAADKQRKNEHVEFLNDALRCGKMFARRESIFVSEAAKVQWDQDAKTRGILRFDPRGFHGNMTDAVLYAYMACHHHLWEAPRAKVDPRQEDTAEELLEERLAKRAKSSWWESDAEAMGYE